MININSALNKMRIARKQGKISAEVQTRTLRRLGMPVLVEKENLWRTMKLLLCSIEKEVAPILEARKIAERDCYDVRFSGDNKRKTESKVKAATKPAELTGYEFTREWWNEAEQREKANRKAKTAARKLELSPA